MALPTNYTATSPFDYTDLNAITTDVNSNTKVVDANNNYLPVLQGWANQL